MMAYGASERSVRLLWRYGILEYLLPLQARKLNISILTGSNGAHPHAHKRVTPCSSSMLLDSRSKSRERLRGFIGLGFEMKMGYLRFIYWHSRFNLSGLYYIGYVEYDNDLAQLLHRLNISQT
ncbi:hypothetical protein KC19_6G185100 [Ceratodon purpureus]|uniref:Uncharacterized protein n=1 Tax=Ceratodon purpureus TaxID=3225 RepID=A0A8T0HHN3_CERPU|nr:hypothetical protein KC19_6G185100 [Ceratodon purpureus]